MPIANGIAKASEQGPFASNDKREWQSPITSSLGNV
jgi:hypothetical protein